MLDRESKCAVLREFVSALHSSEGSYALALRGEAGVGKTLLLDYAADYANDYANDCVMTHVTASRFVSEDHTNRISATRFLSPCTPRARTSVTRVHDARYEYPSRTDMACVAARW